MASVPARLKSTTGAVRDAGTVTTYEASVEPLTITPEGRETRDRIVATAARLMAEGGVAGTTVGQIEVAANVSGSQLYHYFADKRASVRAIINYQTRSFLDAQQPYLRHFEGIEALRAWCDLLVEQQREMHCRGGSPLGALAGELAEASALRRRRPHRPQRPPAAAPPRRTLALDRRHHPPASHPKRLTSRNSAP